MSEVLNHLQPGTMLRGDTYRIVRFIAAGGFGCTYEAEHVLLEKRVAIKEFFMQEYCNREDYTNRVTVGTKSMYELVDKYKRKFIGEAKALSGLNHEGIVSVSDVFEENGTAYFVMDYVDGQPLSGLCKNGPLPERHALFYIRQVCEALAYVHDHNRLHLDLTPANIMVKSDGSTVLIDFGASKQYEPTTGENKSSMLVHTPGYAPLEQTQGDVRQFLPATDIYALGATFYCLLTGRAPQSPNYRLNEEDNLTFPAGISAATRHAVERALEVRKKDRPQSVREFMALLDAAIRPAQAVAPESSQPPVLSQRTVDPILGTHNGHEYVDLGLSVKWATCNVGANTPEEYGNYYAWGETSPKSSYDEDNCKTWKRSMGDIGGDPEYDAARANWGSNWRLPTDPEFEELINNCDSEWTTQNGVAGMRFTSKRNGNNIFFPAAGWCYCDSPTDDAGEEGEYWSSTAFEFDTEVACGLNFSSEDGAATLVNDRFEGRCVRPVFAAKSAPAKAKAAEAPKAGTIRTEEMFQRTVDPVLGTHIGHEWVDLGLSVKWATCNVGANTPEEYGNYYAWGETSPKSSYDEDNCKTLAKFKILGISIGCKPFDDAARANRGGNWRLPTMAECDELVNNCDYEWTTQNGVAGMRFTSKRNGNNIFFPAAGWRCWDSPTADAGKEGVYWSSTPDEDEADIACSLYFNSGGSAETMYCSRFNGRSVRPVLE